MWILHGFILTLCAIVCAGDMMRYDGFRVYRVLPQNADELKDLKDLEQSLGYKLDFWQKTTHINRFVDVMVPPEFRDEVQNRLWRAGIKDVESMIDDVQQQIDATKRPTTRTDAFDYESFNRISEIYQWIADAATTSPKATEGTIGNSYEGRPIKYLKISDSTDDDKLAVVMHGGIHAREWLSPATVMYMAKYLLEDSPEASEMLNKFDFYIIPVLNPDGYAFSHTDERLWRKNRRPFSSSRFVGVDLNRNLNAGWGGTGTSHKPWSIVYCGPSAFSEPETRALRDFMKNTLSGGKLLDGSGDGKIAIYLDYHTYTQLWLYPFGYRQWPGEKRRKIRPGIYDGDPNINLMHRELMDAGAMVATDALREVHNTSYVYGDISNTIYPVSGGTADYAYETLNVTFSYGTEGRDRGRYGFIAPPSEIKPSGEENWAALKALCHYVYDQYNKS